MKNIQKNTQYKRNRGKILLFVIFTMAIFMLNFASAFDFDNKLTSISSTRVQIDNGFGLTGKIAEVTLKSPLQSNYIEVGENQIVLQFEINNLGNTYSNGLKEMKIINMIGRKEVLKSFKWVYAIYGNVEVKDYGEVCNRGSWNNTKNDYDEICNREIIGTHIKNQIIEWKEFVGTDVPKGIVLVGLMTDVNEGDYYDGIPTFFGKEITQWAEWQAIVRDSQTGSLSEPQAWGDFQIGLLIYIKKDITQLVAFNTSVAVGGACNCWAKDLKNDSLYVGTKTGANCSFTGLPSLPTFSNDTMVYIYENLSTPGCGTGGYGSSGFSMPIIGTNINLVTAKVNPNTGTFTNYSGPTGYAISSVWTQVKGTADSPEIITTLTYPITNSLISSNNATFNATYTFMQMNIVNATYYIWNNNGSIFNKTTISVDDALNYSSLNISNFVLGSYKWNVYACGYNATATVCNFSISNYTFNIGGAILNENYTQAPYETSSEKFMVNFSLFPGSNIISSYLVYNGTHYVISDITNYGTSVELKKTIDLPLNINYYTNETKSFYWSFIFSNGDLISQNTSYRNQTVLPINIVYCNNTYLMNSLNFTTYDETNPNPKINATFHAFWNFWTGTGTIKKNYSFEDTTLGNSSFKFCISPNQTSMHTDLTSEITSSNFFPRTYYLSNATINNVTQEVPIRLINTSLGVKFFHTITRSVERIADATVIISKFDVGIGQWVVVGIRKSDDQGEFIEYLELDKDYTYDITQNGAFLGLIEKTSTCEATPCKINLEISEGNVELWANYYDVFAQGVVYNLSYSKYTKNVTYTFVDTSGLATYFRLQVNKLSANQTGTMLCNTTLFATVGSIVCDLTGQTGQFVATSYVSRGTEKFVGILYGTLNSLAETIGKDEGLMFAFLLVVVVGLIGAWNPAVGVLLAGIAFIFACLMGFVMISETSMILIGILVVILLIKIGKNGV